MHVELQSIQYDLFLELRAGTDPDAVPLHHENVSDDLGSLVEEAYTSGILAGAIPCHAARQQIRIDLVWKNEPVVDHLKIHLVADANGSQATYSQHFSFGRWERKSVQAIQRMREEGTLAADQTAYPSLFAVGRTEALVVPLPPLEPPPLVDQPLEQFGVRRITRGSLVPDRPVLVNSRMVEDILDRTEQAGPQETGGAMLGKMIRLPQALTGTQTRIVTLLSTCVVDERHEARNAWSFTFDPSALAEADQIAEMRGFGESVLTVFHTHGWGTGCGNCNQNEQCLLPQCTLVSAADYQLLETLFPSKSTLMPIAGRKLGAEGQRPVLEIHAWRGGRMRPIRWQQYED